MKTFQKIFNKIKQSSGLYKLASYWTAADTVEFNDGQTLEQCKTSIEDLIDSKGDALYYDEETHMLYLLSGEDRISGVEITTGGQGEILGDVSDIVVEPSDTSTTIKWTDPPDGETIEWQGTIVLRKSDSRPIDCLDGTVVVDSTTRNQYRNTGYVDENLSTNSSYFYRFFPYTTDGKIRTGTVVAVNTIADDTVISEFPTVRGTYAYTGNEQTVNLNDFESDKMTIVSGGTYTNAGDYTVVIAPKTNYKWPDNTTGQISLDWSIAKGIISRTPQQSGTVTYTGSSRTPTWSYYDSNQLDVTGDTSATNAGEYTVTFTPKTNYQWSDGTTTSKTATWAIQKALISNTPVQSGTLSYNGSTKTPSWSYYNTSQLTIGGQTSGIDVGTYTAVFTPTSNYQWNDYTTTGKEIQWSIVETMISIPTQNGTLTYDGTSKTPVWDNYDEDIMTKTETAQTNAGTYSTIFSLEPGYAWSDGTTTDKTVNWTIARATITIPSVTSTLKYNGNSQSPTWNSYYDTNKMTLGGTTSGINAGTYSATFTPTSNYQWGDGSINSKTVTWSINKADGTLTLSKQSITFSALNATDTVIASDFNGTLSASTSLSSVATVSVNQASGYITITCKGNGSANITVSVASSTNYTAVSKTISVSASIPQTISNVPTQKNTLTYNASSQTPTWNYYNTSQLTLSGTTSGTNAGNYTAKFTPKSGYVWSDGTNTTKNVTWTIGKANQSLALSTTAISVDENNTTTVTASNYVGTLSANTSNSSIATAAINGSTITINGVASGSATITVTSGSTTNYNSASKTISVTVNATTKINQYSSHKVTTNLGSTWNEITPKIPYISDPTQGKLTQAFYYDGDLYYLINGCYLYKIENNEVILVMDFSKKVSGSWTGCQILHTDWRTASAQSGLYVLAEQFAVIYVYYLDLTNLSLTKVSTNGLSIGSNVTLVDSQIFVDSLVFSLSSGKIYEYSYHEDSFIEKTPRSGLSWRFAKTKYTLYAFSTNGKYCYHERDTSDSTSVYNWQWRQDDNITDLISIGFVFSDNNDTVYVASRLSDTYSNPYGYIFKDTATEDTSDFTDTLTQFSTWSPCKLTKEIGDTYVYLKPYYLYNDNNAIEYFEG